MKKTAAAFIVLMLFTAPAFALTWHTANQSTVSWDSVSYQADAGERLVYVVMVSNALTDPDKTNPVEVGSMENAQYQMTLVEKGSYLIGVKSVIEVYSDSTGWVRVSESLPSWSDDPAVCYNNETFGVRYYPAPPRPMGLKPM